MNAIIVEIGMSEAMLLLTGLASLQLPEGTRASSMWMDGMLIAGREERKLVMRLEHPSFPEAIGARIARVDFTARKSVASECGVSVQFANGLLRAGSR